MAEPPILAALAVVTQNEAVVAVASVAAGNVAAAAVLADGGISGAFVEIFAFVAAENLAISFGTNAHKGSDEVLAGVRTVVSGRAALVQIDAVNPVFRQIVAGRTDAAEGAVGVEAAEGAFSAGGFVAFVDVGAASVGAGRESGGAVTLEAADEVLASPVAADPGFGAFVGVDADPAGRIQPIADRTFAPEGPVGVDAPTAPADGRVDEALVDVVHVVRRPADAFRTQIGEGGDVGDGRTAEAILPAELPSAHADAAALGSRRIDARRVDAFRGRITAEADAKADVLAVVAGRRQLEAGRTLADESALRVGAPAVLTDVRIGAFVDVFALLLVASSFVLEAFRTVAFVAACAGEFGID